MGMKIVRKTERPKTPPRVVKPMTDSRAETDAEILELAEKIKKDRARYAKAKKAMEED